jgi:N-acetyl-gamma-glutamyl-phosphate reductase
MTRVAIVGATGYTGAELVRILSAHPQAEVTLITSRQHVGVRLERIFPAMAGLVDLQCEDYALDQLAERADIVFMALPHQLPMALVPGILQRGKRVIDLSADFRFNDAAAYESAYQPHTAKELLDETVYGLSEVYSERIRSARLVGNPGCYPTSVLLPLIPLVRERLLDLGTIVADSKSGVSGAGRSPSLTTHYCEVNESFKPYKVAGHRHNPEIDAVLSDQARQPVHVTFVPHLIPMSRGMQTTIYAAGKSPLREQDIQDCFASYYTDRPFVRLRSAGLPPDTLHVKGTNYCDIGFKVDPVNNRVILMSAIDNLVKGASGQAVQNMNIMLGLDERTGLSPMPFVL